MSPADSAVGPDAFGAITSLGHNLIGQTNGSTGWTAADKTGTTAHRLSAKLSSLDFHGGSTQTMYPLPGSPAIAGGSTSLIPAGTTTDQRGFPRVVGGKVDIGSVQLNAAAVIKVTAPATQNVVAGVSKSISVGSFTDTGGHGPYTVVVNWGDGSADTIYSVTSVGSLETKTHAFINTWRPYRRGECD